MVIAIYPPNTIRHFIVGNKTYGYETACGMTGVPAPIFYDMEVGDYAFIQPCGRCIKTKLEERLELTASAWELNMIYLRDDWENYMDVYGLSFDKMIEFSNNHKSITRQNSNRLFQLVREMKGRL